MTLAILFLLHVTVTPNRNNSHHITYVKEAFIPEWIGGGGGNRKEALGGKTSKSYN